MVYRIPAYTDTLLPILPKTIMYRTNEKLKQCISSSKPIKNPYVKDTGKKYCKITSCELTEGKLIIHILHILL